MTAPAEPPEPRSVPLAEEDRAILALECAQVVGHTVHVFVLGPEPLSAAELRARMAERLPATPEFRYRLGGTEAAPAWVVDDDLDLREHVVDADVDAPVVEAGLEAVAVDRFGRHLDRSRPLWAIDVVPLVGGETALVWRLHHALADGATGVRLARTALFDESPPDAAGQARTGPAVSPPAVVHADHRRRRVHLMGVLRREFAVGTAHSPFDGEIGTARDVAFLDTSVSRLHAAARAQGATVNDAVLSVLAGGLRRWLDHQAGECTDLRVRVPVSLPHDGPGVLNRDSAFDLPLPLHVEDPVERLRAVHAATLERKDGGDAVLLDVLRHRLTRLAPPLRRLVDRLEASPRAFAVSVSNVPGPREPVAVRGRAVRAVRPMVEIGRHHALRVAAMSTADTLSIGLCVDPHVVPDVGVLAAGLRRELELLTP